MRRFCAFIVITGLTLCCMHGLQAQPSLEVVPEQFEKQKLISGLYVDRALRVIEVTTGEQDIEEVFTLTNTSDNILSLEIERTSCGCIGASLSAKSVAPGKSVTLTFKMRASGWGAKTESVVLRSNNTRQPYTTLTVQAKMPPSVVPNPSRISVTSMEGKEVDRFISLLLPEGATIKRISAQQKFVIGKSISSEPIEDGTIQRIRVTVMDWAPPGMFTDALTFDLENAPVAQIKVPLEGIIEADISVLPNKVFLGQVPLTSFLNKTVIVQSRNSKPFSIQSAESTRASVKIRNNPNVVAASHAVEMQIQITEGESELIQELVKLRLSNGRILEIPIVGLIDKKNSVLSNKLEQQKLQVGSLAPPFRVSDMNGNIWNLSDLHEKKNLLMTFFPKCFTGGCAGQLTSLQDNLDSFAVNGTEIIAVSVDSVHEQRAFAASLGLQFSLIPDTQRELSALYGAAKDKTDLAKRQSVLIDKTGVVRWIDTDINVHTHGADILAKMRELGMVK